MAVTATSFKTTYPAFASETDARIEIFIAKAERLIDSATWGDLADDGVEALTAHTLSRANEAEASGAKGTAGALTSLQVDNQYTEQYANSGQQSKVVAGDEEYATTVYGQTYLALRDRVVFPVMII